MTDRELLELAAKAAGYTLGQHSQRPEKFTLGGVEWNPLTDDGDALRPAVKLKIPIQFPDWADAVRTWSTKYGDPCDEQFGTDPYAATRRAIVRAAAEIGKDKP